jgi:hypothetical protein
MNLSGRPKNLGLGRRALLTRGASVWAAAMIPDLRSGIGRIADNAPRDVPVSAVGTRTGYTGTWNDGPWNAARSLRWMTTRLAHLMPATARDIQFVYGNFASDPTRRELEAPGPNPIRISAEIEYPENRIAKLTFGGQPWIDVRGGDIAVSDPFPGTIPAGSLYFSRTSVVVQQTPYLWPINRSITLDIGDWAAAGTDPNALPGTPLQRNGHGRGLAPYNILGRVEPYNNLGRVNRSHVSVVVVGDSVAANETGDGDHLGDHGYVERALGDRVAWCNLAVSGESTEGFLHSHQRRFQLIGHNFSHAITALGIGDIRGDNENRTRKALQELWNLMAGLGLSVFQTTISTDTRSTDKWTTAEGQTAANPAFLPGGVCSRINAWIRTVPPPLKGYFDLSAQTETHPDSGIWITPGHEPITADGPHLNTLGSEIAAHCIDISKLKL